MRRISHTSARREPARPRARTMRGIAKTVLTVGFFLLGLGGPAWLWQSGLAPNYAAQARKSAASASANLGLFVREIRITGQRHVARESVLAAAGLEIGGPILAFDPVEIRTRVERMAWVRRAVVSRLLPGTAVIEIEERRPFALWHRDGDLFLIDEAGIVITSRGLHRFAGLPLIVGARSPEAAKSLFSALAAEPDLGSRVEAVIRVGERRWDVRLDNGIDVRLPEAGEASAWRELAQLDRRHALLARRISAIDLRIPGRVVVTQSEPAALQAGEPQAGQPQAGGQR